MGIYFNVSLEFDRLRLRQVVENAIKNKLKGYVCIIDANVLSIAQIDEKYRDVLNKSIVNTCDGSSIAMLAGFIHGQKLRAWNGPDIFGYYIEQKYKQLLVGSTDDTLNEIKDILNKKGVDNSHVSLYSIPFLSVEEFDYIGIANRINEFNPDIIWVSLGAPKQELFMNKLEPYIFRGVMFGIGAAFNFYTGKIPMPSANIGALKFIWISRILTEPRKQLSRIIPFIKLIPSLYLSERKKNKRIHL
jgi:N-acetylglucosaminyldiphosphoundecaprenol N-acetyl-beta-D-mannosaminyltransferase